MDSSTQSTLFNISELKLSSSSGHPSMPVIGLGCAVDKCLRCAVDKSDTDALKLVVLEAIKLGYRHFDTAAMYGTEKALGEAIAEALRLGLVSSREQLFITSKLWCQNAHRDHVIPALKKSLSALQMEYLDLYLRRLWGEAIAEALRLGLSTENALRDHTSISFTGPISSKPGELDFLNLKKRPLPMDYRGAVEAWKNLNDGLTKSIRSQQLLRKKIEDPYSPSLPSLLQINQRCILSGNRAKSRILQAKGMNCHVLLSFWGGKIYGSNQVLENEALRRLQMARGKTLAQVSLRWIVENGATVVYIRAQH
ncbi:hypothetical protein CUMW_230530 [Citrus unshiu]|uniref:NADP-dependent oxidoreductase domain-containing protein n=1 Tax=Citrus unshiu TaxID=55188 RepID=A0A2H5QHE1_CITUN|nr:hypothetical protein CUMW_230530 [Citrus unshiu]